MKLTRLSALIASASLITACGSDSDDGLSAEAKLLNTNADIAYAVYSDSVNTAKDLQTALATFKAEPTAANLLAAKTAWLVAREPYGQSEVYRFRNSPIDDDPTTAEEEDGPEGDLNAWPLGEALIDYVIAEGADFNDGQMTADGNSVGINGGGTVDGATVTANIINTTSITINADLFDGTNATNGDETDVITGYHAIEFLLWGQDLNDDAEGTTGADRDTAVKTQVVADAAEPTNPLATGGQRPLTDFTTDEFAARRHQYLEVVAAKLVSDLENVQAQWAPNVEDNYRAEFVDASNAEAAQTKIAEILFAMGTLSYGELAGERIQVAYAANSQEDEHSCFSDNTHRDIWLNAEGVSNNYYGDYAGYDSDLDGVDDVTTNAVNGFGFDDYLKAKGLSALNTLVEEALSATETAYEAIDARARDGEPFDVLIMDANRGETNPINLVVNALVAQSNGFQEMADQLDLGDVVDEESTGAF